jgi:hyperosmotically inducible periplasmic protein
MRKGNLFLTLASVLALTGFAFAGTTGDIENQIEKKTNIANLEVRQDNNGIVLEGQASNLKDKLEAEKIAKDKGETSVVNNITLGPTTNTDRDIEVEVASGIRHYAQAYSGFNAISVKSFEGNVFLEGKVRDAVLSDYAEKAASKVSGVKSVTNKIEILPVSPSDDRLRRNIYLRMANDGRLFPYFVGRDSTIKIIVENSRVSLVGYVSNEGDKTIAEHVVRRMFGVLTVDNQLQVRKS